MVYGPLQKMQESAYNSKICCTKKISFRHGHLVAPLAYNGQFKLASTGDKCTYVTSFKYEDEQNLSFISLPEDSSEDAANREPHPGKASLRKISDRAKSQKYIDAFRKKLPRKCQEAAMEIMPKIVHAYNSSEECSESELIRTEVESLVFHDSTKGREVLLALMIHARECESPSCRVKFCEELRFSVWDSGGEYGDILYKRNEAVDLSFISPKIIGRGRTGSVHQGLLFADGSIQYSAVKLATRKAIENEAQFAERLSAFPNILAPELVVKCHLSPDVHGFIVMERGYCSLWALRQYWMESNPGCVLPAGITLYCVEGAACGLRDLHSIGIVHRDVKAENIIVFDGGWKVRLADNDLMVDCSKPVQSYNLAGTRGFIAPEVLAGYCVTLASDVYALAVTCVQLRTNCFNTPRRPALCHNDILKELGGIVDPQLRGILESCLSCNADERPTVSEFIDKIHGLSLGCASEQEVASFVSNLQAERTAGRAIARRMHRTPPCEPMEVDWFV